MPSSTAAPVEQSGVLRDTIVPDNNGTFLPLDADVEVDTPRYMLVEEFEQCVRFLFLQANNLAGDWSSSNMRTSHHKRSGTLTLGVHIKSFLPSSRMSPHNRMCVRDRLASLDTSPIHRGIYLLNSGMHGLQPMKSLLE